MHLFVVVLMLSCSANIQQKTSHFRENAKIGYFRHKFETKKYLGVLAVRLNILKAKYMFFS